jgi:hypothetical protein
MAHTSSHAVVQGAPFCGPCLLVPRLSSEAAQQLCCHSCFLVGPLRGPAPGRPLPRHCTVDLNLTHADSSLEAVLHRRNPHGQEARQRALEAALDDMEAWLETGQHAACTACSMRGAGPQLHVIRGPYARMGTSEKQLAGQARPEQHGSLQAGAAATVVQRHWCICECSQWYVGPCYIACPPPPLPESNSSKQQ